MSNTYKKSQLDQFYTNLDIANFCVEGLFESVKKENRKVFLEPSAGGGVFTDILIKENKIIAFDLEPQKDYIIKKDFLEITKDDIDVDFYQLCVIGNPPFGKNSSMAIKFFNHCSKFASVIGFILPKTFKKQSVMNRLNLNFHLIKSCDLPKNSFNFEGQKYDVPCVFQIWECRKDKRKIIKSKKQCNIFIFVDKNIADFAIRRVGGKAGTAFSDMENLSKESNYFCKIIGNIPKNVIIEFINNLNFKDVVNSTAGVRSLSKGELIKIVEDNLIFLN